MPLTATWRQVDLGFYIFHRLEFCESYDLFEVFPRPLLKHVEKNKRLIIYILVKSQMRCFGGELRWQFYAAALWCWWGVWAGPDEAMTSAAASWARRKTGPGRKVYNDVMKGLELTLASFLCLQPRSARCAQTDICFREPIPRPIPGLSTKECRQRMFCSIRTVRFQRSLWILGNNLEQHVYLYVVPKNYKNTPEWVTGTHWEM